jgi:hypothetical protein
MLNREDNLHAQDTGSANSDERYASGLTKFTETVEHAIAVSHQASGVDAGPRRYWGSVLFTRLCTTSVSILWLCPGSKVNLRGDHWDFGAVASLTRNLLECSLYFWYLAIEPIGNEEWMARLKVMQLHDCKERQRLFRALDPADPQLQAFEEQANELRAVLQQNPHFASLGETLKGSLLKGARSSILNQDEIYARASGFPANFRGLYRFFSSHAHSLPLAFYRTGERNRGRGEENDIEKGYIAGALEFSAELLTKNISDFKNSFAGLVEFVPRAFDWGLLQRQRQPDTRDSPSVNPADRS